MAPRKTTTADNPKREIWFGVKYRTYGPFTRSRQKIDAIAHAAIVAYKGAINCVTEGTGNHYADGSPYAVIRKISGMGGYTIYDIFELTETDTFTYVATVIIKPRIYTNRCASLVYDDAIIYNKLNVTRTPRFPHAPVNS